MRMIAVFEKGQRLRFVGHLDLMRTMQRALRRSGLPIGYSKGFNPHVLVTFASALSVGAVGKRELMDVTLDEDVSGEEFLLAMNKALPPEMQLQEARPVDDRHPALMASMQAAAYRLELDGTVEREADYPEMRSAEPEELRTVMELLQESMSRNPYVEKPKGHRNHS